MKHAITILWLLCSCATGTADVTVVSVPSVTTPIDPVKPPQPMSPRERELRARVVQVECGFSMYAVRVLLGEPDKAYLIGLVEYYYGPLSITFVDRKVVAVSDQSSVLMMCEKDKFGSEISAGWESYQ